MSRLSPLEIEEIRRAKHDAAGRARDEALDAASGRDTEPGRSRRDPGFLTLLARASGLAGSAWVLRYKLWAPVWHGVKVRRAAAELNRLGPRLLDDIGIERARIDEVAEKLVGRTPVPPRPVTGLSDIVRTWRLRRRTVEALSKLDDHVLRDIGIERWQIPDIAKQIRPPHFAGRPRSAIAASAKAGLRPLRQWNLSRQAANDMARLDPETMADLGYVKGDIDRVSETLAERKLAAG